MPVAEFESVLGPGEFCRLMDSLVDLPVPATPEDRCMDLVGSLESLCGGSDGICIVISGESPDPKPKMVESTATEN